MTDTHIEQTLPFPMGGPSDLAVLLKSLGWQVTSELTDKYVIWSHPEHVDEVLEPIDTASADFEYMTRRGWALLSQVHGESVLKRAQATVALGAGDLEATRWHKETNTVPGLIRWPEGEDLFHSVRDQLAAAAKARQEFRPYFGSANTFVARDFLGKCFLGQSDVGSYVLTAHTPRQRMAYVSQSFIEGSSSAPKKRERSAFSGDEIMRTFDTAVTAIRQSLDEKLERDRLASIKAAVPYGVSYEFTSALSRFIAGGDCAIELRHSMAADRAPLREIAFEAPDSLLLSKAAESFLQDRGPQRTSVTGVVTSLQHEQGNPERIVRIFSGARGPGQRLRLQLSPEHYKVALHAHEGDHWIRVTGTVVREGRLSWMRDPERLEILGESEPEQDSLFGDIPQ